MKVIAESVSKKAEVQKGQDFTPIEFKLERGFEKNHQSLIKKHWLHWLKVIQSICTQIYNFRLAIAGCRFNAQSEVQDLKSKIEHGTKKI